jgi:hypothetical protein
VSDSTSSTLTVKLASDNGGATCGAAGELLIDADVSLDLKRN